MVLSRTAKKENGDDDAFYKCEEDGCEFIALSKPDLAEHVRYVHW